MKTYKNKALIENYRDFYTWLHDNINDVSDSSLYNIDMCAEEIFANIASYAYPNEPGYIEADITENKDEIILKFSDEGTAYNPLEKPDPDITLPPSKRPIGGLGIFMVKQITKNIFYERKDNKNILTLVLERN